MPDIQLTPEQIAKATGAKIKTAEAWTPYLLGAMWSYNIDTPERAAHFLAQVGHESGHLERIEENLNYRAETLVKVWPNRFRHAKLGEVLSPAKVDGKLIAEVYAGKPALIASVVYANRMGNGDEASGDGWRYRGRGLIQLTGRANYTQCSHNIGEDLVDHPERLLEMVNAALSAAWFWQKAGCNALADADDVQGITKAINGGLVGLDERKRLYAQASASILA